MSGGREVTVVLEKPSLSKAIFADFSTEREEWNKYRLADGTLLRAKLVVSGFMMEESLDEFVKKARRKGKSGQKLKLGLLFRSANVFAIESQPELRGPEDTKTYSVKELRALITKEDIDFETVRATWNFYILENGIRVKARISPTSISRTSKFDKSGMPIHVIDFGLDLKINLPERVQKILRKKKPPKKKPKKTVSNS